MPQTMVRIKVETLEKLRKLARAHKRSHANMIEVLVDKELEKNE